MQREKEEAKVGLLYAGRVFQLWVGFSEKIFLLGSCMDRLRVFASCIESIRYYRVPNL